MPPETTRPRRLLPPRGPLLALLALTFLAASGHAATLNVPTAGYPTIQAAVNAASSGDTVLVADGTYGGPGNRDIDFGGKSLTVRSASGDPARTIIDCGGSASANHRGFTLRDGERGAVVSGFTVRNGYESTDSGGGIYNYGTVTHCAITGSTSAGSGGGGVANYGTLTDCTISGNTANLGGGVYNEGTLTGCAVSGNTASVGGGVYGYDAVTDCTITGNTATTSGGGVASYDAGTLTHCTVSGNTAGVSGGGVFNGGSVFHGGAVTGCTISENTAPSSGGMDNSGTVTGCTISGNTASGVSPNGGAGGGLTNEGTVMGCTISGNTAGGNGGGVSSIGTVTRCAISGNTASGGGGGVYNGGGVFSVGVIGDCTISGNTAAVGGGVYNGSGSVTSCTITGNAASDGGGFYNGLYGHGPSDCIVYGDRGGEIARTVDLVSCDGCDIQGGYLSGNIRPGGIVIDADPLFVNAAGGDLHLRAGSPCIGGGVFLGGVTTDKDGKGRPDPPTIGAYEGAAGVAGGHTHLLWNNADGRVMLWSVAGDGTFTPHGFGPYADNAPLKTHKWSATALATGPDGRSYVLWNNTDGRVMVWTVDDAGGVSGAAYFGPYTDTSVNSSPTNLWSAAAISVGPDNAVHLLWNNTDNRVMLWNGGTDESSFTLAGYGPYTDDRVGGGQSYNPWRATALATGPDNVSRILWNNADHRAMLWDVDGGFSLLAYAGYGPYTDDSVIPDPHSYDPGNDWHATAVSVGPDNGTHLLWGNSNRRAMFWNVAADFSFTLAGYGPYTDDAPQNLWSVKALATGPDNVSRILWDNTDHRAMLWGVDSAFDFTVAGYGPYTDDFVSLDPGNLWSATAVSAGP